MAEQSENVEYAGAAVAPPLRQRNTEDLPGVTSALKGRSAARPRGRRLVNSPQTSRQAAIQAMWDEAAAENDDQHNRLEVPHMLLDDVRVGDVVELNTPTAGRTDCGGCDARAAEPHCAVCATRKYCTAEHLCKAGIRSVEDLWGAAPAEPCEHAEMPLC